jgi:2-polyprenyl-6-methoxyphenol hydroxylase-like FAD-dependent oxidoreductase
MNVPNVVIIGAGVGGLCLAQGLRQAGVPVQVYERDQAPDARLQGYRLNIEPVGSRALHDCLPGQLWQLLVATAGDPGPGMGVFTHRLRTAPAPGSGGSFSRMRGSPVPAASVSAASSPSPTRRHAGSRPP